MPLFKNIIGKKFGRLTVIKLHHVKFNKRKLYFYECLCDCGKNHIVIKSSLLSGATRSCGCLNTENRIKMCKNRAKHHLSDTRLHKVWQKMRGRCKNINDKHYGAKGIKVCDEWNNNFMNFYNWAMNNGYDENAPYGKCTIDRINVNGNYEPNNCRIVDEKIQQNNRTNNHFITYNNETHTIAEWAEIYNISKNLLYQRLTRDKMTIEQALQIN